MGAPLACPPQRSHPEPATLTTTTETISGARTFQIDQKLGLYLHEVFFVNMDVINQTPSSATSAIQHRISV